MRFREHANGLKTYNDLHPFDFRWITFENVMFTTANINHK